LAPLRFGPPSLYNAGPLRTREQLGAVLRSRTGNLDETPYALLLLALAVHDANGVLELRRGQLQKTIIFDDGAPVDCHSNIATEMLGRFLVSAGKVKEADVHAAFAVAASRGVPLGEILTERKLLTPSELYRALQQNLGRKLLEPFSWTSGTWAISDDVPPAGSVLRVKVPQLLVTGIQKVEPQENADAAASLANGKFLAIAEDPLLPLDEVRLSGAQQKVVDAARKAVRTDELRASSGIDGDDLNRILYALLLLGAVELTDQPHREAPKFELAVNPFAAPEEIPPTIEVPIETIVETSPPPPAPTPAPPPAVAAASAEEVISAYLSCRRKDAFELLGAAETDGVPSIIKSYLWLSERFLPSKFDEKAPDALREKAKEVYLALARAYAELADPTRREALIRKREALRSQAATAAQAGPALIDPEALWKSGVALATAGKLREALSSFELAADSDAQNGTYAAEAAWCRYRLGITPAATAIKLLKNALRIDPNSGVAHLYAGQVMGILGKKLEGQAYLDRAARLLPNDPRPAEAMKVMR
jgi:tetratricopeptide (TPR) repeat protein